MDTKKLDKEKIEQFVSMGMPKLLAAAYAKAVGSVCILKLVDVNVKNGRLTYAPIKEEEIPQALMYLQEHGNDVMGATTPKTFNPENGEEPKYIVFVQNEPDTRSIELLLAHSIGRPTESIKVEQETKILHLIAEEAMKENQSRKMFIPSEAKTNQKDEVTSVVSPFSVWKKTNN